MSNISKILLNKITDEIVIDILKKVIPTLEEIGVEYFIVGAFARDLGLTSKGFDDLAPRKTKDIDLAVMVGSNDEYESLKAKIATLPDFAPHEELPYRFIFKGAYEIDFLPYGKIYNEKDEVELKAEETLILKIPGFQEIAPFTKSVITEEGLELRFSSLPGVVLLKLFAWEDRPEREKDIEDIDYIIRNFYLLHVEEIIEEDDILEICQEEKYFDEAVSARFIGRKIAKIIEDSPNLKKRIEAFLQKQLEGYEMAKHMSYPTLEESQQIINMLYNGILDVQ